LAVGGWKFELGVGKLICGRIRRVKGFWVTENRWNFDGGSFKFDGFKLSSYGNFNSVQGTSLETPRNFETSGDSRRLRQTPKAFKSFQPSGNSRKLQQTPEDFKRLRKTLGYSTNLRRPSRTPHVISPSSNQPPLHSITIQLTISLHI
jgi:hypothetical protein